MTTSQKTFIARTLKECAGYLLKDCEDAGFEVAALHLRIAMDELHAVARDDKPQRRAISNS